MISIEQAFLSSSLPSLFGYLLALLHRLMGRYRVTLALENQLATGCIHIDTITAGSKRDVGLRKLSNISEENKHSIFYSP